MFGMVVNLFRGTDVIDCFENFYPYYSETKIFSKCHPSLFMYTSFLGNIMYIKRNRYGDYEIHTRNWRPDYCNSESKKMLHKDDVVFCGTWVETLHQYYKLWSTEFRVLCHKSMWQCLDYDFEQPELEF